MTTASRRTTHRRRYRSNAFTTTAVTVVPSDRAFPTAASHKSVGMRSERGMVAMSGDRVSDSLSLVVQKCAPRLRPLAGAGALLDRRVRQSLLGTAGAVPAPRVPRALVVGECCCDLAGIHGDSSSRCVSTVCTLPYLHVNTSAQLSSERAA